MRPKAVGQMKIYHNPNPAYRPPEYQKLLRFLLGQLYRAFFGLNKNSKVLSLPENPSPGATNRNQNTSTGNQATWVGHSTLLCRQAGVYYITDPMFSQRASPLSFIGPRRYSPPGLDIVDLPKISFVLISHNHYDHLDLASVKKIYEKDRPIFLVPDGLAGWFEAHGIDSAVELPWWSDFSVCGLKITSVPAQHFSARSLWSRNSSHWCGWVVSGVNNFYYSGDTGYFHGFREIGVKFRPIDLAALPIGSYCPQRVMRQHHLKPEEAIDVFKEVHGRKLVALHWGTFNLTYEPYNEPAERLKTEAHARGYNSDKINILRVGQTISW